LFPYFFKISLVIKEKNTKSYNLKYEAKIHNFYQKSISKDVYIKMIDDIFVRIFETFKDTRE